MARDTRRAFLVELAKIEPQIARAFEEALQNVRSAAQRRSIEAAIERGIRTGNIARAVQEAQAAFALGNEFFAPLDRAIIQAFVAGAEYQEQIVPKWVQNTAPYLAVRFDGRKPRAEAWTRQRAGNLITEITTDKREVIRATITEGIEENRGQRAIARDLLGSIEGNQLRGGLIGLHSRQAEYVRAARRQLEQLDPDYFSRTRRDKRFDKTVRAAIQNGKPLDRTMIERITGRYADRLLKLRAEHIANDETNAAMAAGRHEAVQQAIDSGKVPADAVSIIWDAVVGQFTREHHLALNGTEIPWGGFFISPKTGYPMERPHDPNAPAVDTARCRCTARIRIKWETFAR